MVNAIWIILVLFAIWFIYVLGADIIKHKNNLEKVPQLGVDYFWDRYHDKLYKRGVVSAFEDAQGNRFVGKIVLVTKEGKLQVMVDPDQQAFFDIKEIKMKYRKKSKIYKD